jgi:hypothetical protein
MDEQVVDPWDLKANLKRIRVELRQGFRLRKSIGLALLFVGVLGSCTAGTFLGMFFYGHTTGAAAAICFGVAVFVGVIGNLIWQRGRALTRRSRLEGEG